MSEMSKEEFLREKADAERRIRELYSGREMSFPDFVSLPEKERTNAHIEKCDEATDENKPPLSESNAQKPVCYNKNRPAQFIRHLNLPELLKSPDTLLILGIILLLMSDNADEMLILALVFIML